MIAISDQNVLLVEPGDKVDDVVRKRHAAGLEGGGEVVG